MMRKVLFPLLLVLVPLAACGDDDDASASASASASHASASPSASASMAEAEGCEVIGGSSEEATGELHVTLADFSIATDAESVDAGVVLFEATNEGALPHEVVILEGPPDDVVVNDAGEVDETDLVGELEAFTGECEGAFSLSPGEYTLLCAIVEESGESHYDEGMVTALSVT